MGTHQDSVQRAVVLAVAVVGAGLNGAFNALICMAVHGHFLLFVWYGISMAHRQETKRGKNFLFLAFCPCPCYDVAEIQRQNTVCRDAPTGNALRTAPVK